ncbi:MAG: tRNA-guanine transglycosylase [Candidatus Methanofastidiosia archaeon]
MKKPFYKIDKIETPHGKIITPALIPVVATSYGIWDRWIDGNYKAPWEMAQSTILSLYHVLQYKRKNEILSRGIHKVLNTKKPIWMDSGGFQYMKKGSELDPIEVLKHQKQSGCDIAITFDYPITPDLKVSSRKERLKRSIGAANMMLARNSEMKLYGAIHGSNACEIKEYISQLDNGFDGYGIGSLVPRKSQFAHLIDIIYSVRTATSKPVHAFGITGFPAMYALSYLGVNTFDSWTYIVAAAFKEYVHPEKLTRIKNIKNLSKLPECGCEICQDYGVNDFKQPTSESEILLSLHNLNIFLREMRNIRENIKENTLEEYITKKGKIGNRNIKIAFNLAKKKIETFNHPDA